MTTNIELSEDQVRAILVKAYLEYPHVVEEAKAIVEEKLREKPDSESPEQRQVRMEAAIQTDFDRLDDVFKALA